MEEREWTLRVQTATGDGDLDALRSLFDEAVAAWGREHASRAWLVAVSGFDAEAVTG